MNNDSEHIYYNVDIYNDELDTLKIAQYQDYRSEPIINTKNNYHVNLVKAKFPGSTIPIHIFTAQYDPSTPSNINNGVWEFGFVINDIIFYREYVQYIEVGSAFTNVKPNPPAQGKLSSPTDTYYWIYSYNYIALLLNNTLSTLKTKSGIATPAPYFIYEDGYYNLVIHEDFVPGTPGYNNVKIIFNTQLRSDILGGFLLTYDITNLDFIFNFNLNTPLTVYNTNYYKIKQEYLYSPQYLSPLLKIIITSNTLRSRSQLVQTNKTALSSNNNNLKIIFTLTPDNTQPGTSQAILNYYSNDFKNNNILDVMGGDSLNSIDLNIYWQDKFLNTYPLYIFFSQDVSLSFLFSKY